MPTHSLPTGNTTVTVKVARATDVTTCLSTEERFLFDAVANGGSVFASNVKGTTGEDNVVVTTRRGTEGAVMENGGRVARQMVRAGWFRFAGMKGETCGWFWLTDSAERVHQYGKRS